MVVFFDTEIAMTYGVNAAILLQNIYSWVRFNKANDKHYHDGRYWTYNSQKALADLFPFVSERTVWTALKKLSDEGLILAGSYNANPYDKTKWYTLTDKGMALMEGKEDFSISQPQNVPNVDAAKISASTPQNPCDNTNIETNMYTNNNPSLTLPVGKTIDALKGMSVPNNAADCHKAVSRKLRELGYRVVDEYEVPNRGDGRRGKIDIVAFGSDHTLAIEVDAVSPREKSIFKVKSLDGAIPLVLLRTPPLNAPTEVDGVRVIGLKASGAEPKNENGLTKEQQDMFDSFWSFYPRRQAKQAAVKAWAKLKPDADLLKAICKALAKQTRSEDWTKEDGKFIPLPASYLNGRRWEDEIKPLPFEPEPQGSNVSRPDSAAAKAALYANLNAQLERMRREDDEKRGIGG